MVEDGMYVHVVTKKSFVEHPDLRRSVSIASRTTMKSTRMNPAITGSSESGTIPEGKQVESKVQWMVSR